MVVILRDGTHYRIDPKWEGFVKSAIQGNARNIKLDKAGSIVVTPSTIAKVLSDEQFEDHEHMRQGDRKCLAGYWHPKGNICAHMVRAMPDDPVKAEGPRKPMAHWKMETLRLNAKRIAENDRHEKIGLIKTEAEYDHFVMTGEWPEYLPPRDWHTVDPMYELRAR